MYFHISPAGSYLAGDILRNLRVRISDPWGKSAPRKILVWLETSKNDHCRYGGGGGGVRLQVPLFSSQCALLLPKNALLFSSIVFLFSRSAFIFLKNALLVIYCASFSKNVFSPADCTFLSCSELLRDTVFALPLFCFLIELFIDQFMMPS